VCYRIVAGRAAVAYAPDVAYIPEHRRALRGVQLYIGDGATMSRTMIRRQGDRLTGHTTIRAQLGWCEKNGVPYAIFTHCGQQIVADDERKLAAQLRRWGRQRGVEAGFAYDGMELILRG
jgi:phosphoribosyl 1,2-cyclic phosphodiesterase